MYSKKMNLHTYFYRVHKQNSKKLECSFKLYDTLPGPVPDQDANSASLLGASDRAWSYCSSCDVSKFHAHLLDIISTSRPPPKKNPKS
jgi:hypothetical protein